MVAAAQLPAFSPSEPVPISTSVFHDRREDWYRWLLEEQPVAQVRFVPLYKITGVARYEDCRMVLTDERFVRNRGRATGKGDSSNPLPIPLPKGIAALASSMIQQDDPEHRRLRNLVGKAFTPRAVNRLEHRVEDMVNELLDDLEQRERVDILEDFGRPIPTRVIAEMLGIPGDDVDFFKRGMDTLTSGFSGPRLAKTLLWDMRKLTRFMRDVIERKRANPGDDVMSALIAAEEAGDRLNEEELLAMSFLIVVAGFETTLHLITNSVRLFCEQPEVAERLRKEPELWDSAVEELVRHRGPVEGTKLQFATEDVELHGYTIKRGSPVIPLLGAANHDPRVFENPWEFDPTRNPNPHLGFGFGMHFCLGAQLARMETRVSLRILLERNPNLRLAVPESELEYQAMPAWRRQTSLPVVLR